ncbi:MAG TPA: histidine kinase [Caproiciproducens sp.]|nr:histidine kinase [Caproiciproducens sp.]
MKKRPVCFMENISLKWGLIGIVILCWILPIAVISGLTGYYITNNINEQIRNTISSSVGNSVSIAVNQINSAISASRYASYNPTIRSAYSVYRQMGDENALYDEVTAFLSQQYKYDDKFLITTLYFCDHPENIYYTYNETYNATYFGVREYRGNVHNMVQKLSRTLGTDIGFINVQGRVYMVRNILGSDYKPYAVLTMQLNTASMFSGLKNVVWETDTTVWLNDTAVVLNGALLNSDRLGIRFTPNSQTFRNAPNSAYLYGMSQGDAYRFSYVIKVDSTPLVRELAGFKTTLVWMVILIVPLLMAVIWFFTRNVSKPVGRLITEAKNIEDGNFGVQIADRFSSLEFQYLAEAFNSMSYNLKYQFDRIYKEELALRDARIMALQSQINPHFLNNTLEIINWEARLARNVKVSRMIEALSTMLDAAMDRKGRPMVHVSEEMMYVDAYLYIISERLGKRLTVKKEIDESLLDYYVPRLVMQPIIENAVEHGIQPQQKGEILIRIFRENDCLIFEVENDGAMNSEDERRIERLLSDDYDAAKESSNNLGIRNVNQRLKIIYGEKSGLTIKMNSKGHAVARIVIAIEQTKQ